MIGPFFSIWSYFPQKGPQGCKIVAGDVGDADEPWGPNRFDTMEPR